MTSTRDQLLAAIETFLVQTGMADRQFGIEANNDTSLVHRLRKGADITTATADRVWAYMHEKRNRPRKTETRSVA